MLRTRFRHGSQIKNCTVWSADVNAGLIGCSISSYASAGLPEIATSSGHERRICLANYKNAFAQQENVRLTATDMILSALGRGLGAEPRALFERPQHSSDDLVIDPEQDQVGIRVE